MLQNKNKEKNGKSLTTADLNCFTYVTSSIPSPTTKKYKDTLKHPLFQPIKEIVNEYTRKMQEHDKMKNFDEVQFVQPNSYDMIVKLVALYSNQFCSYQKSSDQSKLSYSTVLTDPATGMIVSTVKGETDEVVYYNNVCLLLIEDKNLSKSLVEPGVLAQTFAELKGFAERYKSSVFKEPQKFWGILRTGKKWSFVLRVFQNGKIGYFLYQLADLFNEDEIFERQLNEVCILLVWCLDNLMELVAEVDLCNPISSFEDLDLHEKGNNGDGKHGGSGAYKNTGNRKNGNGRGGRGGRSHGSRGSSTKNNAGEGKQGGSNGNCLTKLSAENLAFKENYENGLNWFSNAQLIL